MVNRIKFPYKENRCVTSESIIKRKQECLSRKFRVTASTKCHNLLPNSWTWSSFWISVLLEERICCLKRWLDLQGKGLCYTTANISCKDFPSPSPKGLRAIYSEAVYWGNGTTQTFLGVLDTCLSWHWYPETRSVIMDTYESQVVVNGVLSRVPLTGRMWDHSGLISLISEYITAADIPER